MQYILFLNKFSISLEKLEKKIKEILKDASIEREDNHLILTTSNDVNKIISFDEISRLAEIKVPFTHLKTFEDFRKSLLNHLDKKHKTFAVMTKFITNIPISKRSIYKRINSLLKKENMQYEEDSPELIIYIEFVKKENKIFYRLSFSTQSLWNKHHSLIPEVKNIQVILENPGSVIEISDFIRLCYIFRLQLSILTDNSQRFQSSLNKAKKMTKGVPYERFKINLIKELPKNIIKIGFSIKASLNEKDFSKFIENNNKPIAFLFGDEKYGLTQETRDKLDFMFKLTNENKKPLRASHALSYILGFYEKSLI